MTWYFPAGLGLAVQQMSKNDPPVTDFCHPFDPEFGRNSSVKNVDIDALIPREELTQLEALEARQRIRKSLLNVVEDLAGELANPGVNKPEFEKELRGLIDQIVPAETIDHVNIQQTQHWIGKGEVSHDGNPWAKPMMSPTPGPPTSVPPHDEVVFDASQWTIEPATLLPIQMSEELYNELLGDLEEKEKEECLTEAILSSVRAARMSIPSDLLLTPTTKKSTPACISIPGNHGGSVSGQPLNMSLDTIASTVTGTVPSSDKSKSDN